MIEHYNKVMAWLATREVAAIVCEFAGEGDSGSVECAQVANSYNENTNHFEVCENNSIDRDVEEASKELTYQALEKQGIDWYNNDGGFGHVAILKDGRIICDTNERYTQSTNHTCQFKVSGLGELEESEA